MPKGEWTASAWVALVALGCLNRPLRFGLSIGTVLLAGHLWFAADTGVLHQERSFFGVLRVRCDLANQTHILIHGSTIHGIQSLEKGRCLRTVGLLPS